VNVDSEGGGCRAERHVQRKGILGENEMSNFISW